MSRHIVVLAFLVSLSSQAVAEGPSWWSEVSDPLANSQVVVGDIWLPADTHAAVLVHNTFDRCEPEPPPGITAETFIVWFSSRTLFTGQPEEREESVPYYLPSRRWHEPTGSYVVRLHAEESGDYEVPIQCDRTLLTLGLHVTDGVQPADCGFGFYTAYGRYPAAYRKEHERLYMEQMADYGCNTMVPFATGIKRADGSSRSGADVARQLDKALKVGLLDSRFPVFVAIVKAPELVDAETRAVDLSLWPELIGYCIDEPTPTAREQANVATKAARLRAAGFRPGTSLSAESAFYLGHELDVWAIEMRSMTRSVQRYAKRKGASLWMYNCQMRGTNAALHRYYNGVYTFAIRPEVNLIWAYMHDSRSCIDEDGNWQPGRVYDHALGAPDGPMPTVGLIGCEDGIIDYRVLCELEDAILRHPRSPVAQEAAVWLQKLTEGVAWDFWSGGPERSYGSYIWDVPDTRVPPMTDLNAMRRQALEYIKVLRGD